MPPPGEDPVDGRHQGQAQGPTVILSGRIDLPDGQTGEVHIDVFDGDQQDLTGSRPQVVAMARRDGAGTFEVAVPQSAKKVWVGAWCDVDGNGRPGPDDPSGWYGQNPVRTQSDAVDVVLDLAQVAPPPQGGME
jgi:hypothetical protein